MFFSWHRLPACVLKCLSVILIVKVTYQIVSNYPDYFPPNFDSAFLLGREGHFQGLYRLAFYSHILASPLALLGGLFLISERFRRCFPAMHRSIGKCQIGIVMLLVVPSGFIQGMADSKSDSISKIVPLDPSEISDSILPLPGRKQLWSLTMAWYIVKPAFKFELHIIRYDAGLARLVAGRSKPSNTNPISKQTSVVTICFVHFFRGGDGGDSRVIEGSYGLSNSDIATHPFQE